MKKVSILLLLTVFLTAFSFAQVTVIGGFEAGNVTEGNSEKMDPALWTEFYGAASQELGPGSIGAELGLGTKLHLSDDYPPYDDAGDIYLKGSYALPAGPGELGFGISTWHKFGALSFGLDYDGIAAGPATIGFGIGYDLNTKGTTDNGDKNAIFGDEGKPDAPGGKATEDLDKFSVRLSVGFDFGLGLTYKFRYAIGDDSDIDRIVYLDLNYQVIDPLLVGVEVDDTGKEFKGFTLKPYANYSITEKTSAGIYFKVANIGGKSPNDDVLITPGLTIKHVF
jgi:hypothetical protein